MATWNKSEVERDCMECGAIHTVTQFNLPVREKGSFDCLVCGKMAFRWNGSVDYFDWKLKSE